MEKLLETRKNFNFHHLTLEKEISLVFALKGPDAETLYKLHPYSHDTYS